MREGDAPSPRAQASVKVREAANAAEAKVAKRRRASDLDRREHAGTIGKPSERSDSVHG
jgi:hypothetical protein